MVVGKRTYKPTVRNWYVCSFHINRRDTVCGNGVCAPVDEPDAALLDGVEAAVLTPDALAYVLDRAAEAVRRSLAEDPQQMEALRQRRAETQRKVTRLVEAVAAGRPPKAFVEQVKALETELGRMDGEIAALESRARLGQLDVARALRELEPALAAWREILRGNPVRGRQVLRKLVVGPVVMEPLPEAHGYRWKGQLNGGAVLVEAPGSKWPDSNKTKVDRRMSRWLVFGDETNKSAAQQERGDRRKHGPAAGRGTRGGGTVVLACRRLSF